MDKTEKGLIVLLRSAVTGERAELPDGFSLEEAYPKVRTHHMASLIYAGAVNCGVDRQTPAMVKLFQSYCRALQISERQMRELERVFSAFDEREIDYLPLKGCVMKALYPRAELRMMGDADVLIRTEQYELIVPVMAELGFTGGSEEEHHYVWKSDALCLELHKGLIKPNAIGSYDYFRGGWEYARREAGGRHSMDTEHTFAFLFTHFARHFASAGIGCRHIVDLWVYLRSHPDMDEARLEEILTRLGLATFCRNIRKLIGAWFEGAEADERTEFISQVILSNGSWGHLKSAALSRGIQDMGKSGAVARSRAKYILSRLFPEMRQLKNQYPVLNGKPWLLPAVWSVRLVNKLFVRSGWRRHGRMVLDLNREQIESRKEMLEYVGLIEDE